ncbi:MAG: UPF0104 family protein [Ramlibacter sp.]|nr:UPF0104 family protein [Ramlibacter sp.]
MTPTPPASALPRPPLWQRLQGHGHWRWLSRGALVLFASAVVGLLAWQASKVDWAAVRAAAEATPARVLLAAALVAACGHAVYSCFDLLGRRYTGHRLHAGAAMLVTFISYAFNLSFGAIVGGGAMRLRLYTRLGLPTATTLRVMALSMWTNWFGYLALAGATFLMLPVALPPAWPVSPAALRVLGGALLLLALAYLAACAGSRRRHWDWRGHRLHLPGPRMALAQLAISTVNWLLIAGVIWVLLDQRVPFAAVASVYLVGVVVGIATRVPAGLGVQEAVFVALLSHNIPRPELLAALLIYRALYYWGPLLLAALAYLAVESRAPQRAPG